MRSKSFIGQTQQKAADTRRRVWAPGERTGDWPICLTCGKEVDAAHLENVNQLSAEIRVHCHGAEDYYKINFQFRIEGDPLEDDRANWAIKRAMSDFCAFPKNHEE